MSKMKNPRILLKTTFLIIYRNLRMIRDSIFYNYILLIIIFNYNMMVTVLFLIIDYLQYFVKNQFIRIYFLDLLLLRLAVLRTNPNLPFFAKKPAFSNRRSFLAVACFLAETMRPCLFFNKSDLVKLPDVLYAFSL